LGDFFAEANNKSQLVKKSMIGEWLVQLRNFPRSSSSQIRAMIESSYRINDNTDYANIRSMPEKKSHISMALTLEALEEENIVFPSLKGYLSKYVKNR
jgi:hypothetical protein